VLNAEALKTDTERLTAFYYDDGYITVRVDEPKVERRDDGLYVTIKIAEGDQFKVGAIGFKGDVRTTSSSAKTRARDRRYLPHEQAPPGHPEDHRSLRRRRLCLRQHRARTEIDQDKKTGRRQLQDRPRPEVQIDKILITGNTKTRDKVLRRELKVRSRSASRAPSSRRAATP
jgi:outer membrane protein insertion porin family